MPQRAADKPICKILLNLYMEDRDYLEVRFGRGWTGEVRRMVNEKVREMKDRRDESVS